MRLKDDEYVTVPEFAELAGVTVRTFYQYRHWRLYNLPAPDLKVGTALLWKRSRAEAWASKPRG